MATPVVETVIFKLEDGVSKQDFLIAAEKINDFVQASPGFIRRRLSAAEDGTWIEHVEWESMDQAKAAAAAFHSDPDCAAVGKSILGSSVQMIHSNLEIALR